MKNHKKTIACVTMLFTLLITSCDWDSWELDSNGFSYNLRGTWVSNNEPGSEFEYSGTLVIDFNTIEIKGYTTNLNFEGIPGNSSAMRPFFGFTINTPLESYSEGEQVEGRIEGFIFINDVGVWQDGIPYIYYTTNFGQDEFLRFDFGGRIETLRKESSF